jgi:hypothetical protein
MKVALYTPAYTSSPGSQARVDLIRKSLEMAGHKTILIVGHEPQLQTAYHALGRRLLRLEATWKVMGKVISRAICKQRPNVAILFLDVCASAIPYLKKCGISTILSIEDLTPEYKHYDLKSSQKFYQILSKYAEQADAILSSSYTLSKRLERLGLKAIPTPIGLEPYVSLDEALVRPTPPLLLHAGQLNAEWKIRVLLFLASNYKIVVHNFGKLADKLNHPNIEKYREPTVRKAADIAKRAHIGLILEKRRAYTLTRLYFHLSLLQPIIAEGCGPWIEEAAFLGVKLYPMSMLEEIVADFGKYVKKYADIQKKIAIPQVHERFLALLE